MLIEKNSVSSANMTSFPDADSVFLNAQTMSFACRPIVYSLRNDDKIVSLRGTWQQTQGIHPGLFYCWSTVFDAGPVLKLHRVNAWCLRGVERRRNILTAS